MSRPAVFRLGAIHIDRAPRGLTDVRRKMSAVPDEHLKQAYAKSQPTNMWTGRPALGREEAETDDLVEVKVDSIRVHLPTSQHVVILKEKTNDRFLPIWIGAFEANAIAMKIQEVAPERPITHDLITSTLSQLGISGSRIVITSLSEEVFFARLHLQQHDHEIDVDSRPSDAIALALRFECPIFVAAEVLDRAGVIPEKDEEKVPQTKVDEGRLAVFRDLFSSLDLPDLPEEPGAPGRGSSSS